MKIRTAPRGRKRTGRWRPAAGRAISNAMTTLDLAFESIGDGPPLVVLHGLFGSGRNWRGVARQLATTHRVWTVDLRNHGDSPWADSMDYPAMAEDLRGFMARHGLFGATVLGHSMGGKVAMALALIHAEPVGRLIVVDIAPVGYPPAMRAYARAMRAIDPAVAGARAAVAGTRAAVDSALASSVPDAGVRGFLLQNLTLRDGVLSWRCNLAALDDGMEAIAGFPAPLPHRHYAGPVRFIAGARSDYIRPEHRATILALFPHATHEAVPAAGHWVHAENPEGFLRAVRRALER